MVSAARTVVASRDRHMPVLELVAIKRAHSTAQNNQSEREKVTGSPMMTAAGKGRPLAFK
jgi:hypothetical protein